MSIHGNRDIGPEGAVTDPTGTIHLTEQELAPTAETAETVTRTLCGLTVESEWLPDDSGETICRRCRNFGRKAGRRMPSEGNV